MDLLHSCARVEPRPSIVTLAKDRPGMVASVLPAIVVVEDESLIRHLIVRMIRPLFPDHPIYACPTSEEAYAYILRTSVACVLTDYLLPTDTGVILARTLHMFWPALPIILITGHLPAAEVLAPANFVAVLPKPIPFDHLSTLLQPFLQTVPQGIAG